LLHFRRKEAHGLLRDDAPLATAKGSLRLIDGGENFRAGTFALFPQSKCFSNRVFLALQAPASIVSRTNAFWSTVSFTSIALGYLRLSTR
jgi:hypothetical protein